VKRLNKICTCPQIPSTNPHKPPKPAIADTELIVEDREQWQLGGLHGEFTHLLLTLLFLIFHLTGLCVVQVCAIFDLPAHNGIEDHPLAYIEWFRPLHTHDPFTNRYRLCCSSVNRQWHAAIIRVHDIWQACHLGPRFSSGSVGPSLTMDNVLEVSDEFYFNYYINMYHFENRNC
jgi:hypothetical protein